MIPKIVTSEYIHLSPQLQAQILYCVATNMSTCINLWKVSIQINPNNVVIKHYNNNIKITCSHEWIQMVHVLNNITLNTKKLLFQIFGKFSNKLLLIINVMLSMQHDDIIFTMLMVMFEQLQFDYTYTVETYVNDNNILKTLLYYSKLCGFEYNPHNISKRLIYYFDNTYHIHDKHDELTKAKEICGPDWTFAWLCKVIDPDQKLYLMNRDETNNVLVIGKINNIDISIFVYIIDNNVLPFFLNIENLTSDMKSFYDSKQSEFYKFIERKLGVVPTRVQIHHNLVNGALY